MRLADLALDLLATDIDGGVPALMKLLHSCKLTVASTLRRIKKGRGGEEVVSKLANVLAAVERRADELSSS